MKLNQDQLRHYNDSGFVLLTNLIPSDAIPILRDEAYQLFSQPGAGRVLESRTGAVRAIHGPHFGQSDLRTTCTPRESGRACRTDSARSRLRPPVQDQCEGCDGR
jgi:hypothetical protein